MIRFNDTPQDDDSGANGLSFVRLTTADDYTVAPGIMHVVVDAPGLDVNVYVPFSGDWPRRHFHVTVVSANSVDVLVTPRNGLGNGSPLPGDYFDGNPLVTSISLVDGEQSIHLASDGESWLNL